MKNISDLLNVCKALHSDGKTEEDIVNFLKKEGCSKVESIQIIASIFNINLNAAKKLVHTSRAWEDVRDRDDKFHDDLNQIV